MMTSSGSKKCRVNGNGAVVIGSLLGIERSIFGSPASGHGYPSRIRVIWVTRGFARSTSTTPLPPPRARSEPAIDVRPGNLVRSAASHDSNMSAGNAKKLFVFAAYLPHDGFR